MLTNEEDVQFIRDVLKGSCRSWDSINAYNQALAKFNEMARELLTLREDTSPQMVDALVREIDPSINLDAIDLNPSPVRRLANLAREFAGHIDGRDFSVKNIAEKFCSEEIRVPDPTVWSHIWAIERKFEELILACEREKQRADEAEKIIRELKDNFGEMEVGA